MAKQILISSGVLQGAGQKGGTSEVPKRGCSRRDPEAAANPFHKKAIYCPIEKHANAILGSGKKMVSAMHRLRRNLCVCRRCPAFGECEFRERFNQLIDAVILEINEEWGLS